MSEDPRPKEIPQHITPETPDISAREITLPKWRNTGATGLLTPTY